MLGRRWVYCDCSISINFRRQRLIKKSELHHPSVVRLMRRHIKNICKIRCNFDVRALEPSKKNNSRNFVNEIC